MRQALHFVLVLFLIGFGSLAAQPVDKVIAVVGEEVILLSDRENQHTYLTGNGMEDDGTLRCLIIENLVQTKLLLNKARQDSVPVSEEQVNSEVDKRVNSFLGQIGQEALEKMYGKSLAQIKEDLRPDIEDQLLADAMRSKVLENASITPKEVREFFNNIPQDSLPYLPAEVELYHIVIKPPFSEASTSKSKNELKGIRADIMEGKVEFEEAAKRYSMGPSGPEGGYLGEFGRDAMVAEFTDIVFNMKEGEVSKPFESQFGVHIVKLHKRLGDRVRASHILRIPERTYDDDKLAKEKLNDLKKGIEKDSITFQKAAIRYSQDPGSKDCGGCIRNPQSGEQLVPLDMLDADLFLKVDGMKEGEISEPQQFLQTGNPEKLFHILYLKRRVPPHVANLKDDYQKLSNAALQAKQAEILDKWFKSARKNIYIQILDEDCGEALKNWN